ncbi:hypothetical protein EWX63_13765 [Enterococcus faecium]|nr:hypothetical protein [Enterococcus faecium]
MLQEMEDYYKACKKKKVWVGYNLNKYSFLAVNGIIYWMFVIMKFSTYVIIRIEILMMAIMILIILLHFYLMRLFIIKYNLLGEMRD